jgi:hypothetical protein
MTDTKLSDIIDSSNSVFLNLLYTLLLAAPISCFLQKRMTYFTLPWLYETREIIREYEEEFAYKTKIIMINC